MRWYGNDLYLETMAATDITPPAPPQTIALGQTIGGTPAFAIDSLGAAHIVMTSQSATDIVRKNGTGSALDTEVRTPIPMAADQAHVYAPTWAVRKRAQRA